MAKKNNINNSALSRLCSYIAIASQQGQLINDTLQAQDKVFSSKHVTDLINSMSEQDKKYVDDIVANLNKLSSKTTNVIPDNSNAEPNTLYLYSADPNPTSYNQYMVLSDKTILDLGTTNISLDGYLKETDADSKYLKQVDAHTHSNKSTIDNLTQNVIDNINNLNIEVDGVSYTQDVDGKIALPNYPVPRTDDEIKTLANGQIASSKQVLQFNDLKGITADSTLDEVVRAVEGGKVAILQSANFTNYLGLPHQMYTITINSLGYNRMQVFATSKYSDHASYVGACNNSSGVDVYDKWIKVITDKHVTTTINSSSTDTQVPSAKTIYNMAGFTTFTEDDVNAFGNGTIKAGYVNKTISQKVIPHATDNFYLIKLPWNGNYNTQIWIAASGKQKAYIQYAKTKDVWDTPRMICTTKVADVNKTYITFSDETNYSVVSNSCGYFVKNGICTMMLYIQCNTPSTSWLTVANVPKADTLNYYQHLTNGGGDKFMECLIKTDGALQFHGGTAGTNYLATFSYPVAES